MMTCRKLAELLIDYVSGELPDEHRELVDHHLRVCPPCVAYLRTYELTIRLTRQLPPEPLPAGLAERLKACLSQIERGPGQAPPGGPACRPGGADYPPPA